jgi:hypothetical protein
MLARIRFVADALGRAGKPDRLETATRMAMDADFGDKGSRRGTSNRLTSLCGSSAASRRRAFNKPERPGPAPACRTRA